MSKQSGVGPSGQTPARRSERYKVNDRTTIYKEPWKSPFWYVDISDDGEQTRHSLKTASKREAISLAEQEYKQMLLSNTGLGQPEVTLYCEAKDRLLQHRDEKRRCAYGTLKGYRRHLDDFELFLDHKRIKRLAGITTDVLEAYERHLRTKGMKGLLPTGTKRRLTPTRPKTLRTKLSPVLQLLKMAHKRGWVRRDALANYDLPAVPDEQAH